MTSFAAAWLALREPYDLAARNATVLDAVADAFLDQTSISVADLACGTGATLRAVGPHLPPRQRWQLVDNNLSLLAQVPMRGPSPHVTLVTRPVDLARDLELALDGPLDLITTSALLDLVSAEWLDRLIVEAAARRLPVYAALSYDGRVRIEPAEAFDAQILSGFNLHQRTDKGFGPALGPDAAARSVERLEHFGFNVVHGRGLAVRTRRPGHPGRALCRLGRSRGNERSVVGERDQRMARPAARSSRARPIKPAGGSPRYLRPADRHALSAEIAVEQHVPAENVDPHGRAHGLVDPFDRRQCETRASGAENDRGHQDVQTVETAGGKEARDRVGPAFHQDAAQAACGQCGDDCRGGEPAVVCGDRQDLDFGRKRGTGSRAGDHQPARAVGRQGAGRRW